MPLPKSWLPLPKSWLPLPKSLLPLPKSLLPLPTARDRSSRVYGLVVFFDCFHPHAFSKWWPFLPSFYITWLFGLFCPFWALPWVTPITHDPQSDARTRALLYMALFIFQIRLSDRVQKWHNRWPYTNFQGHMMFDFSYTFLLAFENSVPFRCQAFQLCMDIQTVPPCQIHEHLFSCRKEGMGGSFSVSFTISWESWRKSIIFRFSV